MENKKIKNKWIFLFVIILIVLMFIIFQKDDIPKNSVVNKSVVNKENNKISDNVYKVEEDDLRVVIDTVPDPEFGSFDIEILDIRYTLQRLIDKPIYDYPFYAMKDPNGGGYIGVIKGNTGEALFLVSYKALDEVEKKDLEKSIKAINGTATTYNRNIELAGLPYEPSGILELVKNID